MSRRPWYLDFTAPLLSNPATPSPTPPLSVLTTSSTLTPPATLTPKPLIPPPRLFDRRRLTPPSSLRSTTPPQIPLPWIWRCHHCHFTYRLGVTRRCLEDGHLFCSVPTSIPPPSLEVSSQFSTTNVHDYFSPSTVKKLDEERIKRKKEKRKRKKAVGCMSEFDYSGWENYSLWRREVQILARSHILTNRQNKGKGRFTHLPAQRKEERSCFRDCDFPSECRQLRAAELDWERRRAKLSEDAKEFNAFHDLSDLSLASALVPGFFVPSLPPPGDLGSPASPEEIQAEAESLEREFYDVQLGVVEEGGWEVGVGGQFVLGNGEGVMRLDIDGLGEGEGDVEAVRGRRKSLEEDPPKSPLKKTWDVGGWDVVIGHGVEEVEGEVTLRRILDGGERV